jgi:protein SCO1/2
MRRPYLILAGIALGLSLAAILSLGRFAVPRPAYHGTFLDPPDPRPSFSLRSGEQTIHSEAFAGQPLVVVFGYSSCPDFCPTTMSRLARTMTLLDEEAQSVQVVLVSVDPDRDDPRRIQEYAAGFDPRFVGLTGDRAAIEALARAYGIHHEHGHAMPENGYLVDHTTRVTVLDAAGQARVLWAYDTAPEAMAEDLRTLLGNR